MKTFQVYQWIAHQNTDIAAQDPYGLIVTIVSVSVVFVSLLILFLAYMFIGKMVMRSEKTPAIVQSGKKPSRRKVRQETHKKHVITIRRQAAAGEFSISKKTLDMTKNLFDILSSDNSDSEASAVPFPAFVKDQDKQKSTNRTERESTETLKSPLPGTIISVNVNIGDKVTIGQEIAVLEAMKMENAIECEYEGTVTALHINKGDTVLEGSDLITIE